MSRGMPVLREDHVLETLGEPVHLGHDLVAVIDGECASGTEVVLEINDQQGVGRCVQFHAVSLAR